MKTRSVIFALALTMLTLLSACENGPSSNKPELGETIDMTLGGYTIRDIVGYIQENDGQVINFYKEDNTINIMVLGLIGFEEVYTPEEIIDEFLLGITQETSDKFQKIESVPVTVDGIDGTAFSINGTFYGDIVEGETFVIMVNDSQILFGFGLGAVLGGNNFWVSEGQDIFDELIDSIDLLEVTTNDSGLYSACPIASDSSYGYSLDNPIMLGGGEANAQARAADYFSALGGPYGETLTYEKSETIDHNGAALDVYQIDFDGIPLTLYFDVDNYETLMAPDGFICWEEIPVSAP